MENQKICGKGGVYAILIDDVIRYIGSSVNMESRKSNHLALLRGNKHTNNELQELFNKFGEDSFKFYVLDYCDIDSLYELENHHILIHRDTICNSGRVIKLDKYIRDEKESQAFRQKLSKINSGENNPNSRLSEEEVKEIIRLRDVEKVKVEDIADKFDVSQSLIYQIRKTRWTSIVV